jgi:hypothetical protein
MSSGAKTEFGFQIGPAKVEAFCMLGAGCVIGITTPRGIVQIRVTPTGYVMANDLDGVPVRLKGKPHVT